MAVTDRTRWHRRIYFGRHFKGAALAGFLAGPMGRVLGYDIVMDDFKISKLDRFRLDFLKKI